MSQQNQQQNHSLLKNDNLPPHGLMLGFFAIISFVLFQISEVYASALSTKTSQANAEYIIMATIFALGSIVLPIKIATKSIGQQHESANKAFWHITFCIIAIFFCNLIWLSLAPKLLNFKPAGLSSNQQALNALAKTKIGHYYMFFLTVVFAPIVEEFMFRFCIIKPNAYIDHFKLNNKWRFAISVALFAFAHMMVQLNQLNTITQQKNFILAFGQYLILSIVLAYNYYRSNNYWENVIFHGSYNCLAFILSGL